MKPARSASASGGKEDRSSFLGQCLVESDRSEEKRERRNKQRALVISIVVQILIVAALVIFPLFSKGENITSGVVFSPPVPYARGSSHPHNKPATDPPRHHPRVTPGFFEPKSIPVGIVTKDPTPPQQQPTDDNNGESDLSHVGNGGNERGVDFVVSDRKPDKPREDENRIPRSTAPRKVSELVQQALLIHRVEPTYPILAVQARREGRVLLHAFISPEGHIESLQVVSGDPMFIRSAVTAVNEWRYRPTILNGQAVEVETYITVIYTLSH